MSQEQIDEQTSLAHSLDSQQQRSSLASDRTCTAVSEEPPMAVQGGAASAATAPARAEVPTPVEITPLVSNGAPPDSVATEGRRRMTQRGCRRDCVRTAPRSLTPMATSALTVAGASVLTVVLMVHGRPPE